MGAKLYPTYRDSGVEWIGEIPEHWEVKAFRTLGQFYGGLTGKAGPDFTDEGPNTQFFIPFTNILNNTYVNWDELKPVQLDPLEMQNKVVSGDLLFLMSSEDYEFLGWSSVAENVPRDVYLNSFCKGFHLSANVSPAFINYFNKSIPGRSLIGSVGNGFTRINLRTSALASVKIPSPPLQEQKQIAAFLDRETSKIDTLIGKQQQLINLLKEKRGSLISHTVTKGLNPNVPMKDSGVEWIGEIPEHWEVKRVKNLLRESFGSVKCGPFGSDLKNDEMTSEGIPVFNQRVVIDNNFSDFQYNITDAKFEAMRPFEAFPGDILITTRGTIGKVCTIPNDAPRGILHPCVMRLQVDTSKVDCGWFVTFLRDENVFKSQLLVMSNATTIEVIYQNNLVSVFVPFPPLQEQKQISSFLDAETSKIDALIEKANQSIALLKERRSSLISAAVTGKIDVRGVA